MKRPDTLHFCGAGLSVLAAVLTVFSFSIDPAGHAREIVLLLLLLGGMFGLYLTALAWVVTCRTQAGLTSILVWAVVIRLLLFPGQPILETDYYRYLWDGFVLSHGINPYLFSPQEVLDDTPVRGLSSLQTQALERLRGLDRQSEAVHAVLSQINNPTVTTIYPPFTQFLFGVSAHFFPLSMYGWRLIVYLFDAVLILALIALLARMRFDPRWVIVYAWSPLICKEILNTLHFDGIATALLFLGILLAGCAFRYRAVLAFACAALTKLYPLLIAPLWFKTIQNNVEAPSPCPSPRGRGNFQKEENFLGKYANPPILKFSRKIPKRALILLGSILLAFTFPFTGAGERGLRGWAIFADRWESNSSLVALLEWLLEDVGVAAWGEGAAIFTLAGNTYHFDAFLLAKLLCAAGVLLIVGIQYIRIDRVDGVSEESLLAGAMLITGAILLGSPVGNPWYYTWIVPFLCFFPRLSWLYLTFFCFIHYTFFIPQPWGYWPGARELEYIPFFLLLLWEWRRGSWRKPQSLESSRQSLPSGI